MAQRSRTIGTGPIDDGAGQCIRTLFGGHPTALLAGREEHSAPLFSAHPDHTNAAALSFLAPDQRQGATALQHQPM